MFHPLSVNCGSLWLLCLFAFVGCGSSTRTVNGRTVGSQTARTLVVVMPSIVTSDTSWTELREGETNFASELIRHASPDTEVVGIRWPADAWQRPLTDSAKRVVEELEQRMVGFDRIVLVGHSHGGNVALLAAGQCSRRIDQVICLSTPHIFLRVASADDEPLNIPVFCTKPARENSDMIVTIVAEGDEVSITWINLFTSGTPRDEAVRLSQSWLDEINVEAPKKKGFWKKFINGDDLFASDILSLADEHFIVDLAAGTTSLPRAVGVTAHVNTHDAVMGRDVGLWLSGETNRWQALVQ